MAPDELLRHLVEALEALDLRYAIGGSMASIVYGEPRATLDIDVVVDLAARDAARLKDSLEPHGFVLDDRAARDAIRDRRQFKVLHPESGMKVDVFVMGDVVERSQIERRRRLAALPGLTATFSPPEELIVKKLEYHASGGGDKHLRDIASMLVISGEEIDRERIEARVGDTGLEAAWKAVLEAVESDDSNGSA